MKNTHVVSAVIFLSCILPLAARSDSPIAFHQLAKLTASDGRPSDWLGYSIAMSGDTLVAGAPQFSNGGVGKAYVFVKPATGWADAIQTAELTPSAGFAGPGFGWRVAINGDTIVVDAGSGDGTGTQAVYVFVEPVGGWTDMTETAKLTLTNGNFLFIVALNGNTIAAGATEETVGSNQYQGAVYIFEKPKSGWRTGQAPTARLTASDGRANDYLGFALSMNASTLVATSPNNGAYVFVRPSGGWKTATQNAKLTASNETGVDEYGYTASISGGTIVVGAYAAGANQAYIGAAYLYFQPSTGWVNATQNAEIMASNAGNNNYFGVSVEVAGDFMVVGADGVNVLGNQYEGAAYVFEGTTQITELTPTPGQAGEEMGWSVAASGNTVAAGAVYANVGSNSQQGMVYVFAPQR